MEDGVPDMIFSQKEEREGGCKENGEEEKDSVGGVMSNFITSMVSKNGDDKAGVEEIKQQEEDEDEKNPGGGVISNFISSMVSKNGNVEEIKQENGEEENEGGIFNNLISGILHHGGGGDEKGKHEGNEAEDGGAGDGGLIDNLVSHLPPPLADDAAPAPDEASILIHSIIHD